MRILARFGELFRVRTIEPTTFTRSQQALSNFRIEKIKGGLSYAMHPTVYMVELAWKLSLIDEQFSPKLNFLFF